MTKPSCLGVGHQPLPGYRLVAVVGSKSCERQVSVKADGRGAYTPSPLGTAWTRDHRAQARFGLELGGQVAFAA